MPLLSNDRALLDGFRRGERWALARVYQEYAPLVARFLGRGFFFASKGRTLQFNGFSQPFDLDNALQETFVRAFSERARLAYDGISPYRNYLFAVARNYVIGEHRRREVVMSQLVKEVESDHGPQDEERWAEQGDLWKDREPSGEEVVLEQELTTLYQQFVQRLEGKQQALFHRRFEQRMGQVEAGRAIGLSQMQVRTMEKKLRRRFLKFMQTQGYLETFQASAALLCFF